MTFEEILNQAVAMLQRRGRMTYRMLKRQFQLDDAALEDLKVDKQSKALFFPRAAAASPLSSAGELRAARP